MIRGLAETVKAIQKKEISCEKLCSFYLERIREVGLRDGLNCVLTINENALEEARAIDAMDQYELPLCGLTVLVKDNIDVKGMSTTAGSIALKDNIAKEDADIIRMLRDKGAVILGKTNMTEFANFLTQDMPNGYSSLGGQVVSAYGREKDPSGSSSGSAVAMCARLCSFSVGTDTSFSVVGCATENGVVGFKPAAGRLSSKGIIPITQYFDSVGFFTASVEDMLYLFEAIFEDETIMSARKRRLLVNDFNKQMVSIEQLGRYESTLSKLSDSGYEIDHTAGENTSKLKELMTRCFALELQAYLADHGSNQTIETIIDTYKQDMERYAPYGIEYLEKSNEYRLSPANGEAIKKICADMEAKRKTVLEELEDYDACLMTGPTCMMHYVRVPSISIPFAIDESDGLPCSMILYAKNENCLLDFARVIKELKTYEE